MHGKINLAIPELHDIKIQTFLIIDGLQIHPKRKLIHSKTFVQLNLHSKFDLIKKTILKSVLDKMIADKRLGRNLKGMNKSNMV